MKGAHVSARPDVARRPAAARPTTWFAFAVIVTVALVAVPFGARRAREVTSASAAPAPPSSSADPVTETGAVPDRWAPYTAPDGTFEVLGPDMPETVWIDSSFGPAHVAKFENGAMTVAWTDGRVPGATQDAALLQEEVSRVLEPVLGLVADEEEELSDLGHPGFGLALTTQGTIFRIRIFAANGRLYEIIAQTPAGTEEARQAERLVDSFTLR